MWDKCYSWIKCGKPLVEDSIRLIGGISTLIGSDLLADSNDRCTAWISYILHWFDSSVRLNEHIETKGWLKQTSLTETVSKDYHPLLL